MSWLRDELWLLLFAGRVLLRTLLMLALVAVVVELGIQALEWFREPEPPPRIAITPDPQNYYEFDVTDFRGEIVRVPEHPCP